MRVADIPRFPIATLHRIQQQQPQVGNQLMGLYFANTSFGSTYSAAGSPIVVLLWVYYSAQLFFWGAEFTKVYTKTEGSQRDRQR